MSLGTIQAKHRHSELKTGTHLVSISAMTYARDAEKNIMLFGGHKAIIVTFKSKEAMHDQFYLIDKGPREKYFTALKEALGLDPTKPLATTDFIGKKLWVAIQEVHWVKDDEIVKENGEPLIEYQIFKTIACAEGVEPKLKGDPLLNNGIAQDEFITYKNTSNGFIPIAEENIEFMSDEPDDEAPTFKCY